MASLDVTRPAAQEQLEILGAENAIETLPIIKGQKPTEITKRACKEAKLGGFDVLILDTAGRMNVDDELMDELQSVNKIAEAHNVILVADSLTGQDAVNVADTFSKKIPLTGVILTRLDGDARGGAALSMRHVTGKPILFAGIGEKIENLEEFYPDRVSNRILGMGDVISLVERAQDQFDLDQARKINKKIAKNKFGFDDFLKQIKQVQKMGSMKDLIGMIPGANKMIGDQEIDDDAFKFIEVIIGSMTPKERSQPDILDQSRRKRIANGSGRDISEINQLIKQFNQMSKMMKMMQGGKANHLMQMFQNQRKLNENFRW